MMYLSKQQRRKRVRARAFPEEWQAFLERAVPLYGRLPNGDHEELQEHIQVLLDEKHFEGAGGFEISEQIRLIVTAQAGILLLHRETDYFPKLVSIVIYPGTYAVRTDRPAERGLFSEVVEARAGESWTSGTIVLSWSDVERDVAGVHGNGSVILHEFAHQLDAENGAMNGAPILSEAALQQRWPDVLAAAYERLAHAIQNHQHAVLRPYAATNPAEFFAVATEAFFLQPAALRRSEPGLYDALCQYFRQDPVRWP